MADTKPLVTITGITGYIGSQVGMKFLESDKFRVRGTVRSKDNAAKIDPLKIAYGDNFEKLELVEADLLNPESMSEACKGSEYVVHVASPFPLAPPENDDDLIKPAVDGTTSVMTAAIAAGAKKVVVTSSCVSIGMGYPADRTTFTEEDWSKPEEFKVPDFAAYATSKTLAEKKAWEIVEEHNKAEGATRIELVAINPGLVIGPNLNKASFSSGDIVGGCLMGAMPMIPAQHYPMVDVRDVAQAHLEGVLRDEANGKRFILNLKDRWVVDIPKLFKESGEFPGYNTHEKEAEKDTTGIKPFAQPMTFVNNASKEVLGIEYIPFEQSILDMGNSLIATGYIPAAEAE
jgi:nucleoside-diphosphate-sugar epimerase